MSENVQILTIQVRWPKDDQYADADQWDWSTMADAQVRIIAASAVVDSVDYAEALFSDIQADLSPNPDEPVYLLDEVDWPKQCDYCGEPVLWDASSEVWVPYPNAPGTLCDHYHSDDEENNCSPETIAEANKRINEYLEQEAIKDALDEQHSIIENEGPW